MTTSPGPSPHSSQGAGFSWVTGHGRQGAGLSLETTLSPDNGELEHVGSARISEPSGIGAGDKAH